MNRARKKRETFYRRRVALYVVLALIVACLLTNATSRYLIGNVVLPVALQIAMIVALQVIQVVFYFGFLTYYLSGTKTEKTMPGDARSVTLDDYRGQPVISERARYLVRVLEGWGRIRDMGGEAPRGVLLIGGPGTGKTYLGRCLAGEVGVPFFMLDASGLVSMWMGMGSIKVRRFFATLKKYAKRYGAAVAFLDELDAIGAARSGVEGQGMAVGPRGFLGGMGGMGVLNTLLSCMDGLEGPSGFRGWITKKLYGWLKQPLPRPDYTILVIASTNRPAVLDTALTRAGRFDMQLRVTPPTKDGLKDVLVYYLAQVRHAPEIDVDRVASALRGAVPADVKTAVKRNAVVFAERAGRDHIIEEDIYEGAWEAVLGLEVPSPEPYQRDQKAIALHEAGHAIAAAALFPELMPLLVTIIPHAGTGRTGPILGVFVPRLRDERQSLPLDFLGRRIMLSMAGRESGVVMGRPEMGFLGDRQNIQNAVAALIAEGAFGYSMAVLSGGTAPADLPQKAHEALNQFLENLKVQTQEILRQNKGALEDLADLLLTEGTLTAARLEQFFANHPIRPPDKLAWIWAQEGI